MYCIARKKKQISTDIKTNHFDGYIKCETTVGLILWYNVSNHTINKCKGSGNDKS